MAFEAVLNQDQLRPQKWKRITVSVSLVLHAAALVVGVAYSFWRVDELPLPSVVVTLMAGAPPPPPPPPPPAGGTKKKTTKPKTKLEQPKTEMVQPKEQPKEAPPPPEKEEEDEGEEGGVKGGEKGGVKGGVVGGVVGAPPPPPVKEEAKILSAPIGHGQLAIDPNAEAYKVQIPPSLNRSGIQFSAIVTVSVSAQGQVLAVAVRKGADPAIDPQIPVVIRRWRYRPYVVDGHPVPFKYTFRYDVSAR